MVEEIKRKQQQGLPTTAQRVVALEKSVKELTNLVGRVALANVKGEQERSRRTEDLEEVVGAMVDLFGREAVEDAVKAKRVKKAEEDVETAKKNIAEGVEKGILTPTDVVQEGVLLVGSEQNEAGEPTGQPAWGSLMFEDMREVLQARAKGLKVGDIIRENDETLVGFVIKEIYLVSK